MIKTVWLDNPPVNAVNGSIVATLTEAFGDLEAETRVVVLRGKGHRAFSAGVDIASFADGLGDTGLGDAGLGDKRLGDKGLGDDGLGDEPPGGIQPTANLIEACPVPVVAAIHGYCLGGGLELALACDVRIAHADAWLGFPEVRLGLLPGGGGTQRLPRAVGSGRAAWMIMSGEQISARQAEEWGLLERVVEDLDAGIEQIAGTLAKQSPKALREIKALLRATRDKRDDEEELKAFHRCLRSEDGREGVAAFLEKREPRWSDD